MNIIILWSGLLLIIRNYYTAYLISRYLWFRTSFSWIQIQEFSFVSTRHLCWNNKFAATWPTLPCTSIVLPTRIGKLSSRVSRRLSPRSAVRSTDTWSFWQCLMWWTTLSWSRRQFSRFVPVHIQSNPTLRLDDDDDDIKFNGTSTLKGSYIAKTVVNCPMSLNRVYYTRKECYGQMSAKSKAKSQVTSWKKVQQWTR